MSIALTSVGSVSNALNSSTAYQRMGIWVLEYATNLVNKSPQRVLLWMLLLVNIVSIVLKYKPDCQL